MRFGLQFRAGLNLDQMRKITRTSDEKGVHSVFTTEIEYRDAFIPLAVFASETKRIILGTGIVGIFTRSPVITAMTIAALDEFSRGRTILGLGTSPPFHVKPWHGVAFEKPFTRMKEYVHIVREVLKGEKVKFSGKIFQIDGFRLGYKPYRENVPIYLAAVGPKMIELAGEVADGVILPPIMTPEYLSLAKELLAKGAEKAGRDVRKIDLASFLVTAVSEDRDQAIKAARSDVTFYSIVYYYRPILASAGFDGIHDRIRETNKQFGFREASKLISDEMIQRLTICGTPDECKRKIETYLKAGLTLPVLYPPQFVGSEAFYWKALETFG